MADAAFPPPPSGAGASPTPLAAPSPRRIPTELGALLDRTEALATGCERADLAERIRRARERLASTELTVLVVGEFKQGKSTLVNALLNVNVCAVADDVATVVPMVLRHGEAATATAVYEPSGAEPPRREPIDLNRARALASELGNPANREGVRAVEVQLPRRLLEGGLTLVDTPGVGGLDSAHGAATLGALGMAEVVVFVTDASQPLTLAELRFLHTARERCPNVLCVLTKTDIYPHWRVVAEENRSLLAKARADVDILAVSSVLRMDAVASNSTPLNEESGYPPLLRYLRDAVEGQAATLAARTAASDVVFVADQLEAALAPELDVLENPDRQAAVLRELERAKERADQLRNLSSRWQTTLNDGVTDLTADVDHDLRMRLRALGNDADKALEQNDPLEIWDDFEQWLRTRTATEVSENYDLLRRQSDQLAQRVAEHFAVEEAGLASGLSVQVPHALVETLQPDVEVVAPSHSGNALAAVRGGYGGLLMFGMFGQMIGMTLLNPLTVFMAFGLGRKSLKDERKRSLTQRQQQARIAVRKHIDDVTMSVGKDMRDTVRRIQRQLRDEFSVRADELVASTREALMRADEAVKHNAADQAKRVPAVRADLAKARAARAAAEAILAPSGEARAGGAA